MSKNVFALFAIKHTQDFLLVKKAYMLKVIEHKTAQPNTPLSPSLQEAWAEVNSPEKLSAYYRTCVAEEVSENHYLDSDTLAIPVYDAPDNTIDVFIPVDFAGISKNESRKTHSIAELYKLTTDSHQAFAATIDCGYYAQIITNLISNSPKPVGVTAEEAEDIVNYHSHHYPTLIVQIRIFFNHLLDFPRSDKPCIYEHLSKSERIMLREGENQYFSVKANTKIDATNIVSIYAMNNYGNGRRFDEQIEDYWPQGFLFQPNVVPPEPIENHTLAPTLQDLAQKEIKRLEEHWFSTGKISALKKATRENDTSKIQEALTLRRWPLVDYFFGRTHLPTTSQMNSYEIEFENGKQNNL